MFLKSEVPLRRTRAVKLVCIDEVRKQKKLVEMRTRFQPRLLRERRLPTGERIVCIVAKFECGLHVFSHVKALYRGTSLIRYSASRGPWGGVPFLMSEVQGHLVHKKTHLPRTLP